jgi:hypothetical protein
MGSHPDEVDFFFFFQIYLTLQPHYGPVVDSAYNRNEYQEPIYINSGGKGLTTLPPSVSRLSK